MSLYHTLNGQCISSGAARLASSAYAMQAYNPAAGRKDLVDMLRHAGIQWRDHGFSTWIPGSPRPCRSPTRRDIGLAECHCANVLGSWAGMPEDTLWSRCCLRLAWLGHFEIPMIVSERDSKTKPR